MLIQSTKVFIASQFVKAQVEIMDGKIVAIYPYGCKKVDVDYGSLKVVPGFYDVHTHGFNGYDASSTDKDGLRAWVKYLPSEGVCGVCPTTLTQSHETLEKALITISDVAQEKPQGAEIIGIHFEGPFINKVWAGAQPEQYIVVGSPEEFDQYQKAAKGMIKIMTYAPETDENFVLTRHCAAQGVRMSMGHTDANYDTAIMALANGAMGFTHTYNAMTPLKHRENGVVGASFRARDTYSEVICDGNHSTLAALSILFREKQDHAVCVTDSLMCKGYPAGTQFDFGGQMVEIYPDGSAHIMEGRKQLAGSTLKVNDALKVLVNEALVPFEYALDSMTCNPCKYLGIDDHKGYIKVGYDADIVVLNDDFSVKQTYCNGIAQL